MQPWFSSAVLAASLSTACSPALSNPTDAARGPKRSAIGEAICTLEHDRTAPVARRLSWHKVDAPADAWAFPTGNGAVHVVRGANGLARLDARSGIWLPISTRLAKPVRAAFHVDGHYIYFDGGSCTAIEALVENADCGQFESHGPNGKRAVAAPPFILSRSARIQAVGRRLLVLQDDGEPPIQAASYSPRANKWQRLPDAGAPELRRHAVVLGNDDVVLFGGKQSYKASEPVLDGAIWSAGAPRWQPIPAPPLIAGNGMIIVAAAGKIFVWGGRDLSTGKIRQEGAVFDTRARQWRIVRAPSARLSAFNASVSGSLVLFGEGAASTAYDVCSDRWLDLGQAGPIIGARTLVGWTHDGRTAILNGWNGGAAVFDPATGSATLLEGGRIAGKHGMSRFQQGRFVIAGGQTFVRAGSCGPPVPDQPTCDPVLEYKVHFDVWVSNAVIQNDDAAP